MLYFPSIQPPLNTFPMFGKCPPYESPLSIRETEALFQNLPWNQVSYDLGSTVTPIT